MADVIKLNTVPKHIREAVDVLRGLSEEEGTNVVAIIGNSLLQEIKDGIEGVEESPFFKLVDALYDEITPHGCYFCDVTTDVNETDFDDDTVVCLSCRAKLFKRDNFYIEKLKNESIEKLKKEAQ